MRAPFFRMHLFILFALSLLTACSRVDVKAEIDKLDQGIQLVDHFSSKMTIDDFTRTLNRSANSGARIVYPVRSNDDSSREYLQETVFELQNARIANSLGDVRFVFYQDRLASVIFIPENHTAFLQEVLAIPENFRGEMLRGRDLRITVNNRNVVWSDDRITKIVLTALKRNGG